MNYQETNWKNKFGEKYTKRNKNIKKFFYKKYFKKG